MSPCCQCSRVAYTWMFLYTASLPVRSMCWNAVEPLRAHFSLSHLPTASPILPLNDGWPSVAYVQSCVPGSYHHYLNGSGAASVIDRWTPMKPTLLLDGLVHVARQLQGQVLFGCACNCLQPPLRPRPRHHHRPCQTRRPPHTHCVTGSLVLQTWRHQRIPMLSRRRSWQHHHQLQDCQAHNGRPVC